jgi:hypothetical protein
MIRSWGFQTLNGNAQPLFGDSITAAFSNVKPNSGLYTVKVANSALYYVGDRIILGVASGDPTNCLLVGEIKDSTTLLCQSEGDAPLTAWAINTQLALDIACYGLQVQEAVANANPIYIGADSTVTNVGGGSAFYELLEVTSPAQPNSWSLFKYDGQNPLRTTEAWLAGTNTQKFAVAAYIN